MNRVMAMTSRLDLTLEARSGRRQDLRRREGPPGLLAESPGRKRIENLGSDHETGRSPRRGNGMAGATAPFLLLREKVSPSAPRSIPSPMTRFHALVETAGPRSSMPP